MPHPKGVSEHWKMKGDIYCGLFCLAQGTYWDLPTLHRREDEAVAMGYLSVQSIHSLLLVTSLEVDLSESVVTLDLFSCDVVIVREISSHSLRSTLYLQVSHNVNCRINPCPNRKIKHCAKEVMF